MAAHYSRATKSYGGIAIYINNESEIEKTEIDASKYSREQTCEFTILEIKTKKHKITLIGLYRAPSGNVKDALETISLLLDEMDLPNSPILIMGDINIDSLTTNPTNTKLESLLATYNIHRLQLPATRVTPTSTTSIDCICTNLPQKDVIGDVIETGISDHKAQLTTINKEINTKSPTCTIGRILNNNNLNNLNEILTLQNWATTLKEADVNSTYNSFITIMTTALNTACPKKTLRPKSKNKNYKYKDKEATALKERFLIALHKYKKSGLNKDKEEMANLKKAYDLKLKQIQQVSNANYIATSLNKTKSIWKVINKGRNARPTETPKIHLETPEGQIQDPTKVATALNKYFASIADNTLQQAGINRITTTRTNPPTQFSGYHKFELTLTNNNEIKSIIATLQNKNSSGFDEISPRIIKHCAEALVTPLVNIANKSFTQGIFPTSLKLAKVYPKYKKGPKTDMGNYRPISLLPTFSKILEKLALKRLINYLTANNNIPQTQHGFTKGKSTTTAIASLMEHIIENMERGMFTTALFLDYSKAFDCLGHDLILNKLETLGVVGKPNHWFRSYLEGRTQTVEIQYQKNNINMSTSATPLPTTRGVPQGSVLGPALFILLLHDFPNYLENYANTILYADDTTLMLNNINAEHLGTNTYIALNMSAQYCQENDLVINPQKTKQLIFGRKKERVTQLPDITPADSINFLGLQLDNNFNWNTQITELTKKLSSSLYILRRIKNIADTTTAKTAYHSLFESHMRYGLIAWGSTSKDNMNKILKLQKKAIRTLANLHYLASCREAFKTLKIKTVFALYIELTILHADKLGIPKLNNIHNHNTRNASKYSLPTHSLSLYEKRPSYAGALFYNHLPPEFKDLSGNRLKHKLEAWTLNNPWYSIEEFKTGVN